jgi:hypothetical protein
MAYYTYTYRAVLYLLLRAQPHMVRTWYLMFDITMLTCFNIKTQFCVNSLLCYLSNEFKMPMANNNIQ